MKRIIPYFRQVHLDFHTSEHIPSIGSYFNEDEFSDALKTGHVDSINFFGMCHHGWCYYPSETNLKHPHLDIDLVGGIMNACRKADVNPVIYITVGFNEQAARQHPEWCIRKTDGRYDGPETMHPASPRGSGWKRLCLNTPYLSEIVLTVTKEIMEGYHPSGIFFDITDEKECLCDWCMAGMKNDGLDIHSAADRKKYARKVFLNYLRKTSELIWGFDPGTRINHNSSITNKGRYDLFPFWSHSEIESLPTGGWGYEHFPPNARYFTLLQDNFVVGMTGKFHKTWGEFGGFKSAAALRYEAAQIMSLCCGMCIGDQLHPGGRMDKETYRIIGSVYKGIEKRQPWLLGAELLGDVAILSPECMERETSDKTRDKYSEVGASMILMEAHIPHVVVDEEMDFSHYQVLILPDNVRADEVLSAKLNKYIIDGGSLILSSESGLSIDGKRFAVDVGAQFEGNSPWDIEYIEVTDSISDNLVRSPFLMYESGTIAKVEDAHILAHTWQPYFSRTHAQFCSHGVTPPEKRALWPAVIRKNQVIYISQPIFRSYAEHGMQLHRDLLINCLNLIYTDKLIEMSLPSAARVSVTRQEDKNRDIIHVTFAVPMKRGDVEVVEDIIPLRNVEVIYRTDEKPNRVYSAPEQTEIPFVYKNNSITFCIEYFELHHMIVIEY